MTHRPHQPLLLRHRALAMLSALACLVLQATTVAHMGLVQHSYCAAHGEFVHGSHVDERSTEQQAGWHAGEEDERHEHCPVAQLQRAPTLPQPATIVLPRPFLVANRATAPPVSASFVRSQAVWRSAPKTSPPA